MITSLKKWKLVGIAVLAVLLLATTVSAQEPIVLDEITSGEITAANPVASYSFSATAGQFIEVEVVSLSDGFIPTFTIRKEDASLGVWYAISPDTVITDQIAIEESGVYVIQVGSTRPTEGQFVLTLTEVIPPPVLAVNVPMSGNTSQTYQINADPNAPLVLNMRAQGLASRLTDGAGNEIATLSEQLAGGFFNIPPASGEYLLEISNPSSDVSVTYEVTLHQPGTAATEEPVVVTEEAEPSTGVEFDAQGRPILPETGACILATLNNTRVNVRTGPSGNNAIESTISQFEVYPVTGRNGDRTWFEIDYGDGEGWAAISVTRLGGNCANVEFVDAPIAPPPTNTPSPIPPTSVPAPTSRALDPSLGTGDADGDGIANNQDFCPFVSGVGTQFGGVTGADGCPVDSDSDGINDGVDQCPFAGGPQSNNGCP
jgi:hypothetical protein